MSLCCLCVITCSGGQLKWGLCVVLRPILQGALHIRSIIQQQLWQRWEAEEVEGRGEGGRGKQTKKKGGEQGEKKIQVEGGEGMLQSGLARGKNLNWWKPKPAQKVTDILATLHHYAVCGGLIRLC